MPTIESELLGLAGKAAVVTGATSGIGRETARLLAGLGAEVVAVGRKFRQDTLPGGVVRFEADVSDPGRAADAVAECVSKFGKVDILVNNAGTIKGGSLLDFRKEDWDRIMDVNLGGYRNYASAAAKAMVAAGTRGRIVNVASVDGISAEPGVLAYSASKGAIIMFTKCAAIELAPHGIRVNAVAPGWVDTPMGTGLLDASSRKLVDGRIPLGYIAPPEEIARSVAFLASDMAAYMTGEVMVVDGGLTVDISIPGLKYE
ncbi:MAG: SDR family oxidoreductase [Nitrososphaerota archaeon]|jgi:3-oxoacyl-[acyl-carrier protein] reductase|nr:SDR family oxidoreductase [Nitrososphaerota archaeon]MCL5672654.1 SDR family oxidoreductase [Nitrososphaerota archaeon]MDG6909651.1 SDR family oxidoreductase [Nitrososphaerota archaeon]MDG6937545.1 SDR family oxidoreductase [Nitrososphaerota archaeon]MDG6961687.1 SDR family oxidoreductase [Nitrososphaerota archaeon]